MTTFNTTLQVKIKKTRVGRGIGSGKGKTSGRGVKGQKSRSGVAIKSFEGGQMPLFRRLPKRGFNPLRKDRVAKINLYKIQEIIDKKILTSNILNLETLKKSKLVANSFNKIKILGSGDLKDRIEINVDYVSKSAKIKLEKNGSKINLKKKV
jgi:large subunit ribosomal protein L15|tara:strand:- start:962 stop:1417 length:456 start_codon:yes stop_codon:yes gene_type:complete